MPLPLYRIPTCVRMTRRTFLHTASLSAASLWASRALGAVSDHPAFPDYPFKLGVASGDPAPDGMVLWTRLAPKPLEGGGMPMEPVSVSWQLCEDEQLTKVVREGTTVAHPDWGHSVHVEVEGLEPDRWYWYRFMAGGEASPAGRTRTMPAVDSLPERLRFAFASCQHYETGYYTGYEHMAQEDIDLVLHLGDYIYEDAAIAGRVRRHQDWECQTVEDYRNRYALYRSDPALQAMHARAPWIMTPDDHEVDNNYAGAIPQKAGVSPGEFLQRRAAAYQAWYEAMPLRRSSLPSGPDMQIHRRIAFGRLASFFALDTRQHRTDQPCGDGTKPPCDEAMDPNATILGEAQRDWLFDGLGASGCQWNVLAQQVMMARVDRKAGPEIAVSMDQWPGYEIDRRRVLKCFRERNVSNPIVLTGDIHSNWANELIDDFDDLESAVVGAEFVGTSISSGGDGAAAPGNHDSTLSENPFVKFYNAERGYVRCEANAETWRADFRTVDYVSKKGAPIRTRRSFVLETGRSNLNPA